MSEHNSANVNHAVHERCWCWQHGRCLVDCPTADVPRPQPMTDENWHRAWLELKAAV